MGTARGKANVQVSMNRRTFVSGCLAAPIVGALTACRDTHQRAVAIDHPTGADDVVLKLAYAGGLMPENFHFLTVPTVLVSGDRRVFTPAAVTATYPGPLVPPMRVHQIGENQLQSVLAMLTDARLLAPPVDYSGGTNVADATDIVLTISAAGSTFVHSAYALGSTDPETGSRKRLLDAEGKMSSMLAAAGAADEAFVPTTYRLQARALRADELVGQDQPPTVVDWPARTGLSLADAATCALVAGSPVGSLFLDADQNIFFREGDNTYQLFVAGVLPGDAAC